MSKAKTIGTWLALARLPQLSAKTGEIDMDGDGHAHR